jgi:glycosyltransferase involved in cell wall biosynthesis
MEGIPVALMEAMASGLPVIATNLSGIPELVQEGKTGWLVSPEDSVSLAEVVLSVYQDPFESKRRASAGRDLVHEKFHLQTNVRELSSLFENLIGAQRK